MPLLARLLDKGAASPMVLQLGGSSPGTLAAAVHLARDWGYDEINLNCALACHKMAGAYFSLLILCVLHHRCDGWMLVTTSVVL